MRAPDNPFTLAAGNHGVSLKPAAFLIKPVYVLSPIYHPNLPLDICPVAGCEEKGAKKGFMSKGFRTIYGLEHNIKVIGLEYTCTKHKGFSTSSPDSFWRHFKPWEIDAGIVFFSLNADHI